MFYGGTLARMLCTCWKTKPPTGAFTRTCSRTCPIFLGRAVGQDALGIATAAPEGNVLAEIALRPSACMRGRRSVPVGWRPAPRRSGPAAGNAPRRSSAASPSPAQAVWRAATWRVPRLEELAIHPWRDLRPVLRPRSSPKLKTSIKPPTAPGTAPGSSGGSPPARQEPVRSRGLRRQQHQEAVHAVVEMPHLQRFPPNADDRAIRRARTAERPRPVRPGWPQPPRRRRDPRPHVLGVQLFDPPQVSSRPGRATRSGRSAARPPACAPSPGRPVCGRTQSLPRRSGRAQAGILLGCRPAASSSAHQRSSWQNPRPSQWRRRPPNPALRHPRWPVAGSDVDADRPRLQAQRGRSLG